MGHNQSSPHSADYPKPIRFPRAFNDRLNEHAYEISHTETNQPNPIKRSSSFIDHVPSRQKQMREDIMSSYNDCSDIRISSTTLKTKRPSTVKSHITSQDRRRSEDFDMGQMEENIEVLKKNSNFSENITCIDSTIITNEVLSKTKGKAFSRNQKTNSFLLSSCQTSSGAYHSGMKPEYSGIGPHFFNRASQRMQGKQVDDEVDVIMRTETGDPNFQSVELVNKDVHITEASLCRMESVGLSEPKLKENKIGDDEVRILETGGSRLSSPKNLLTNRYSPELQPGYSHKKSSNKKEAHRYVNYARPMMIASFEDEYIGSHLVKDSDLMSLSSSEGDHAEASFVNDEIKNLSPEKTVRGTRSHSRKDGAYQEVEFSFKPNSMSKGSRRYTTEDEITTETKFNDRINKNIFIHEPDLDAENPLIKSLHFNSIEFVGLKPSVEDISYKISPCKSSANNVLQDINNVLYSQENNRGQNITEKKMSAHNILYDSKDLLVNENTKDTSKDSQPRAESPSICYPGNYFQSKMTISDEQKELNLAPVSNPSNLDLFSSVPYISNNDKDTFVEEPYNFDEGAKENRPAQTNQNIFKLQQITNSDSKIQREADPVKSPEIYSVGHILQNMKKGIREQIHTQEGFPNGLMKNKHYYQAHSSVSDKGHSFSKETSAVSSSFFRLIKDSEKLNKAVQSRSNQVYTLREDYQGSSLTKRPNLRIEKLRPKADNYTNESQGSFYIDDSVGRMKRRKSELNNSRVQRGGPVVSHNKTLTQETCYISTATSRNEVSMNSVKLAKQASKIEISVECDQAPRNLHKGAKSVTSSRTSVERNTPLLKKPVKKGNKDHSSTRDSQSSGKETMYTLILPMTSPKEIDTKRMMIGIIDQKRKALSQQGKLNKTASRILSEKEDYSQDNRTAKTPTSNKKPWNEREQSMVRSRSAANQKKGHLNETLDLPEKPFPRASTGVQDEKTNGISYNAKVLKNLLRGQMERPLKKAVVSDKSDRDIKVKVLNKTAGSIKEKAGAKSPFLKKPYEAR